MALPLIHRIDHTPVLVLEDDYAWDKERINRELAQIEEARGDADLAAACPWPTKEDHPFERYRTGASRFDLSTVAGYLKPDIEATRFTLRRLDDDFEWPRVQHLQEQDRLVDARRFALQHGLVEVVGLGIPFPITTGQPLDTAQVKKLRGRVGDSGVGMIGAAVINVSRELFDAEKKR
jgi:hypothetical protein